MAINRQFMRGTAALAGTMIGVGVFGIPFAFAKSGFWIGLVFFVITGLATLLMNLVYAEIVLRTKTKHQLVGYAGLYQGVWAKRFIFFTLLLTTYAALLSYVIVSGEFLNNVLSPFFRVSPDNLSFIFFTIAALLILLGIRAVSWVEVFLASLFMGVILFIFISGVGKISISNFSYANPYYWFFPYGIFLFAFSGMAAIPIQRRILEGQESKISKSIFWAMGFVALAYLIFGLTVFGISGEVTSPEAINGLSGFVGDTIVWIGSLFGILAVSTSFLMLGSSLLEVFSLDYNLRKIYSWALVVFPPVLLYLGGVRNFIDVISLAGAVSIGLESAILVFIYKKAQKNGDRMPEYRLRVPLWFLYVVAILFLGGAIYEFVI